MSKVILRPNWQKAADHQAACRPGIPLEQFDHSKKMYCECCSNLLQKHPIPICENTKQLHVLGFGFPLFYSFIRQCIILLSLTALTYSILSVYQAIIVNAKYCANPVVHGSQGGHGGHSDTVADKGHSGHGQHLFYPHMRFRNHFEETKEEPTKEKEVTKGESAQEEPQVEARVHCTSWMIWVSRTDYHILGIEVLIRLTAFLIHICALIYIREELRKTESYYDERTCSISDYSILVKKVPNRTGIKDCMIKMVKQITPKVHIQKIVLIANYQQIQKLEKKQKIYTEAAKKTIKQPESEQKEEQMTLFANRIAEAEQQINLFVNETIDQEKNDMLECENFIVIFSTEVQKLQFLYEAETFTPADFNKYFGPGSEKMKFREAPEPRQILWENLNCPASQKIATIVTGWLLSVLFIAVVTVIFFFFSTAKSENLLQAVELKEQNPEKAGKILADAYIYVYFTVGMIIFFNKFIMSVILHGFTHIEKHGTTDSAEFSFALKYALGMFFTTALMTIAVQDFQYHNFFTHPFGVVEQETLMFIFNSFMIPLIWLINPIQIYTLIKRKYNYGREDMTQQEANAAMEDSKYDMGKRYAELLETMWFVYFYLTLIPIGSIFAIFGLMCYYWVDKVNLACRLSLTEEISGKLCLKAITLLDLTIVLRAAGEVLFDMQIRDSTHPVSIVCLVLSLIYMILPLNKILDFFNQEKFNPEYRSYEDAMKEEKFDTTYHEVHPIYSYATKAQALKRAHTLDVKYTEHMLDQGEISPRKILRKVLDKRL